VSQCGFDSVFGEHGDATRRTEVRGIESIGDTVEHIIDFGPVQCLAVVAYGDLLGTFYGELASEHWHVPDVNERGVCNPDRMRFAFSTSPQRTTWPWMSEVWKRADDLDVFESGWTFDHLYPLMGDSTEDCMEGWITLTALLHETRRLRGGVLVTGMVYRHPGVLANMASTLDITSGGRLELGIGAGWNEEECDAFGIDLGTLTERFDRFEEGLAVLKSLLTNDRTTFNGRYYNLTEAMNNPKPVQCPLPICIGGAGKRRTLPLAARFAHHWNYSGTDPEGFATALGVLRDSCAAIGRDPAEITCSTILRWTGDAEVFRSDVAAMEAAGAQLAIVSLPKSAPPSVVAEIAASAA
jgi:F420-dependent oxidoreductase-like protein